MEGVKYVSRICLGTVWTGFQMRATYIYTYVLRTDTFALTN